MFLRALYRMAWEPLLWSLHALAALERLARAATGRAPWPARWRIADRLFMPSSRDGGTGGTIWLHAASLGEAKGLWAFAHILRRRLDEERGEGRTKVRFLFTTNTVAGLAFLDGAIARAEQEGRSPRAGARLAPPDHPRFARRFLKAYDVRALVFFEVELWPHWIAAARRAGVPTLWISARLTARARRLYAGNALSAGALRRVLRDVTWIQAQTEGEEHALRRLGARDIATGGDLRGLHYLAGFPLASTSPARRRSIAFVSLHARELPALLPAIRKAASAAPDMPLFVFPRRLEESPLFVRALAPSGFSLHSQNPRATRVIVDTFGRVGETLARVRTAVVGGSFGPSARIGGHNLWEPLLAGTFIVIGPHHDNQAYLARRLEAAGLSRVMGRDEEFPDFLGDAPVENNGAREARATFIATEGARLAQAADIASNALIECLPATAKTVLKWTSST